jgi:hypothetical protein
MHRTRTEDAASALVLTLDAARCLSSGRCVAQGSGDSIIAPSSSMRHACCHGTRCYENSHTHYRNIPVAFACLPFPPLDPAFAGTDVLHSAHNSNARARTRHPVRIPSRQRSQRILTQVFKYGHRAHSIQPYCPRIDTQIQVHARTHTRQRTVHLSAEK